ncbi:histidine phosphatase family protein [Anaerosalibacter sp. Marseille-P3206]|uniref:histidine phosphatase family protein n=1 Tax=Anaerosalibacter sp. Marseille-P3206 TaxID=1871005 RepID=UPI000987629B|nr:histidine phosphatase family protein [Anaerosalibacter sp. Marseille-P3206]
MAAAYSSPYKRAVDTIKDFADNSELEIITDNDLCERRVGEWVEDFRGFSEKQWQDFDFKLLGGESLREVQERNVTAILNIIKNNLGKSVVIGTHGTALSTIINYYNSDFGHADFLKIVDKMPYILCFKFSDMQLESIEEVEI